MQDATAGSQDAPVAGYSLQEAAALLGIGVNTLRRRIATGQVRAEQVERPQGYAWRVYLGSRHPASQPTDQEAPRSLPHPPAPLAQAEALASLIQATLAPIVAPLVAEQAALRQVVERQADQLVQSAEQRIRLTAELEQGKDSLSELQRRHDQTVAFVRWLLLAVAVLALVTTTLAVIVVLAPAWVR